MFLINLENQYLYLFFVGLVLLIFYLFTYKKFDQYSSLFIFLITLCIFGYAVSLDAFLNNWDERFHALVAKNMMTWPLKPMLYSNPILDIDYNNWALANVWLHKQPLFLWQSAISFKLFGSSEIAFRLPSVLLGSFMSIAAYRTGKRLFGHLVGVLIVVLFLSSLFHLQLVSGRQSLGQNDFSFMVYVSLSIWAWVEWIHKKHFKWVLLIGAFAGLAVLCKWLVGLLVFLIWSLHHVLNWSKTKNLKAIIQSLIISMTIFLPWQIFAFIQYPEEYLIEMKYNAMHFYSVIEGHNGEMWFHFTLFEKLYGNFTNFLIIPACIYFVYKAKEKSISLSIVIAMGIIYLFFTIAETKMESYPVVLTLLVFTVLAKFIVDILNKLILILKLGKYNQWLFGLVFIVLFLFRIDIINSKQKLDADRATSYHKDKHQNTQVLKSLNLAPRTVLFNVPHFHYVEAMFYTNQTAYSFLPSIMQVKRLKEKGYKIAILRNLDLCFPNYLELDSEIRFIDKELKIIY
jgi:4-amino-4-deoxy-L-arabinose transferase